VEQIDKDQKAGLSQHEGKLDDELTHRIVQMSAAAGDLYAVIEKKLRDEFDTLASGTMLSVASALKQVLWDGRKDTRAQLEDRVERLIRALEEGNVGEGSRLGP